jgi:hypothetical protein
VVAARTTDELITACDTRCLLPSGDTRLTTTEKLEFATQRVQSLIAELLSSARSQRWVQAGADVAITTGVNTYDIPERALASGVADIVITDGTVEWSAPEFGMEDASRYRLARGGWDSPYAYCWLDDKIELLPHPQQSAYSLRIYYPRAVPKLVPIASCAVVTGSNSTTITATSAATILGTAFTADVVKGSPNGNPRGMDLAATASVSTVTITTPAGVAAGDYVCIAGTTCVLPMPQSLWQTLVLGVSCDMAGALGYAELQGALEAELGTARKLAQSILEPRSRGARERVASPYTPLRQRRAWR